MENQIESVWKHNQTLLTLHLPYIYPTTTKKKATPTNTDNNAISQLLRYLKHHPAHIPIPTTPTMEAKLPALSSTIKVPPYRYRNILQLYFDLKTYRWRRGSVYEEGSLDDGLHWEC